MDETVKRKMNPRSLANLRPIQKGEVRNPKGPPKKVDCLIDCIREELGKPSLAPGQTNEQMIASMLVAQATKGNLKAAELVLSYTTPKPTAEVSLKTIGTHELIVRWDGNRNIPCGASPPSASQTG